MDSMRLEKAATAKALLMRISKQNLKNQIITQQYSREVGSRMNVGKRNTAFLRLKHKSQLEQPEQIPA